MTGSWTKFTVDHKDRDQANNRWDNLRELDGQQQAMNKGLYRNNKSGVPGVWWRESAGKWRAYIRFGGKLIQLGHYHSFEEALQVRKEAERRYFKTALELEPGALRGMSV